MTEQKKYHKGNFVGGYLTDEQMKKIQAVEKLYDEQFGEPGRNRTRAIRYIIDCFEVDFLKSFPKDLTSKSMNALTI